MRKLVLLAVCSLMLFSCGKTKEEELEEEVYRLEAEKEELEAEKEELEAEKEELEAEIEEL